VASGITPGSALPIGGLRGSPSSTPSRVVLDGPAATRRPDRGLQAPPSRAVLPSSVLAAAGLAARWCFLRGMSVVLRSSRSRNRACHPSRSGGVGCGSLCPEGSRGSLPICRAQPRSAQLFASRASCIAFTPAVRAVPRRLNRDPLAARDVTTASSVRSDRRPYAPLVDRGRPRGPSAFTTVVLHSTPCCGRHQRVSM